MVDTPLETPVESWHRFVETADAGLLGDLLAEDVVFHAPAYWKPRQGKQVVMLLLATVAEVFENFEYHREWVTDTDWALEFSAQIGEFSLKGVDLIHVEDGLITDFEVMVRPPNAVVALRNQMEQRLAPLLG